jgi:phosphatidylinositol kinase/protein kinase (PI-3  family)
MVHALSAIRKKKSLILDTCEIFVKEPLLDWFKDAKQRNKSDLQDSNNEIKQEMTSIT